MKTLFVTSDAREPIHVDHNKLLCWKSILAGLPITFMSYMILTALGAGISGLIASNLITHEKGGAGLTTAADLWLGLSVLISLFFGGYYTLRVSRFVTNRVGAAHGFVLASIFFLLLTWGASTQLGNLSAGLGNIVTLLGNGTTAMTQDSIEASRELAGAGWILFVTFILGLTAAVLGGRLGAHANQERPIHEYQTELRNHAVSRAG